MSETIEIEEWTDTEIDRESLSMSLGSGQAYHEVGNVNDCGLLEHPVGPGVCNCPPMWGSCDDADYSNVTGWIVVTDLDGAAGAGVQGRLLAAYWNGKLWLKFDTSNDATGDDDVDEEVHGGAGIVGDVGDALELLERPGRAMRPNLLICPIEARENYLRTNSGGWRGDLYWEVLANYCYSESGHVYDQNADGGWGDAQCWRVTIWMIVVDDVLCFWTSRSAYLTDDLKAYAPFASRLSHSAWGLPYDAAGYDLHALNENGGPWYGYYCALLPWEADGTDPVDLAEDDVVEATGPQGLSNYIGEVPDDGMLPQATGEVTTGIQVCGRVHNSGPWGIAYWNAHYGSYWPFAIRPGATDLYQEESWEAAIRRSLTGDSLDPTYKANGIADFVFDARSVEGRGILPGYTAGAVVPDQWQPNGPDYVMVAYGELTTPNGTLYLGISGSMVDGVLLTASAYAEPVTWADPDPDTPNPPHYNPPGDITPPIGPGAGGGGGSGGSGSGGGGSGGGSGDDEPDSDPVGWPPALTSLPDGIYLTAGSGVNVSATQQIDRDSDGRVSNIRYKFTLSAAQKKYTGQINLTVSVQLTVSGGGSYTVWGIDETMYYGFSSETSSTVTWASSYIGGGGDPTTSTVSTTVSATARTTINISDGTADSESVPTSNILNVNKTGGKRRTCVGGIERYFDIYTVSLNNDTLKTIAENAALNAAGSVQATLENSSVTGSNSGPPSPPTVSASVQGVTVSGSSGGDTSITGCMSGIITGTITPSGTGSISISGSGSWLYDDESEGGDSGGGGDGGENSEPTQSRANGSISGNITVTVQSTTF